VKVEYVPFTGTAPLSSAVKVGDFVYTSGTVGVDRANSTIPEGIEGQTRACFENLREVLEAAGTSFENVVKANVYLTNMDDFAAMNAVYAEVFPENPPARTTVGIEALANPKLIVEIELVALVG